MELIELYYIYCCHYCPYFWKNMTRKKAKNELSGQKSGTFILRPSERGYQENFFGISFVSGKEVQHGHILLMDAIDFGDEHLTTINDIGQTHLEKTICDDIYYGLQSPEFKPMTPNNSLKFMAQKSILESMKFQKAEDWFSLKQHKENIFQLNIPKEMKIDIFGMFLTQHVHFRCVGIIPCLLPDF